MQWLTFHARHEGARGLSDADTDPEAVLDRATAEPGGSRRMEVSPNGVRALRVGSDDT